MNLPSQLRERIAREGAISVADYMELCNTHYYATRDPFGTSGDFTTAPEISQIFGELIGAWLASAWLQLGSPNAVLCELGPGRGTLMSDILRATASVPQFHASLRVMMIETSPVLQALQRKTLQGAHQAIKWQHAFAGLPSLPLLLVANEFFDALPVRQFLHTGEERMITMNNHTLAWLKQGTVMRETSPASLSIMQSICAHIKTYGGAALAVDYGYAGTTQADTLQSLRHHQFHNPLEAPGEADLTTHVDFGALRAQAEASGLRTHFTTQGDFLRRLGAELRATALCKNAAPAMQTTLLQGLERLVAPAQMGELFKVLCATSLLDEMPGF